MLGSAFRRNELPDGIRISLPRIANFQEKFAKANAFASTLQACAPQIPPSQRQWMFGS